MQFLLVTEKMGPQEAKDSVTYKQLEAYLEARFHHSYVNGEIQNEYFSFDASPTFLSIISQCFLVGKHRLIPSVSGRDEYFVGQDDFDNADQLSLGNNRIFM